MSEPYSLLAGPLGFEPRIHGYAGLVFLLLITFVDQFASSVVRAATETHLVWVVFGELHTTPTLCEPSACFFFANFFAELECHVSWDGFLNIILFYLQPSTPLLI